jgi:hypothetical protein
LELHLTSRLHAFFLDTCGMLSSRLPNRGSRRAEDSFFDRIGFGFRRIRRRPGAEGPREGRRAEG